MGSWLSLAVGRGRMANKVEAVTHCDAYTGVYHEKQVKELCAIHAINNLLQKKVFVQKDFEDICLE